MIQNFSRQLSWVIVLVISSFALLWIWIYPNDSSRQRNYIKMLGVSSNAFQQAVIYAHLKYHSLSNGEGAKLDLLELDGSLIDFNENGFPMGNSHTKNSIKLAITTANCRELWNDLLHPMRPMIFPEAEASLTVSAHHGKCVFTSIIYPKASIEYQPKSGRVSLTVAD